MQGTSPTNMFKLIAVGCMALLVAWIASAGFSPGDGSTPTPQSVAGVPQQYLPGPESTQVPEIQLTPTEPVPTPIPTPEPMQAATWITSTVTTLAPGLSIGLSIKSEVNSAEPIQSLTWAPTGDKLVYVTNSGKLYWSNIDGSSATLLHDYGGPFYATLDQQPLTNTLLVPGYAIHFTPGQPPVVQEAPDTWNVRQIRWWSPDRATGVTGDILAGGCPGCERTRTFDSHGNWISTRVVPFMSSGAVRPGGGWLAYATSQQNTSTPFSGSDPETVYLLNLNTGQRLRVTGAPGSGNEVFSWSPNGNWFLMSGDVNGDFHGVLVSADGQEQLVVTSAGSSGRDAVWSPDSTRLAFSTQIGGREPGCGTGDVPPCEETSAVYIVNVPSRQVTDLTDPGSSLDPSPSMMMRPGWSPDGTLLTLLSFDRECIGGCSGVAPAFYIMSAK